MFGQTEEGALSKTDCCSLVVPVVRDEVGHGYCHLFLFLSFLSSLLAHCFRLLLFFILIKVIPDLS